MVLQAQTGPVFSHTARPDIDNMALETAMTKPLYDFTAADGIQHTIWHAGCSSFCTGISRGSLSLYCRWPSSRRQRQPGLAQPDQSFGHTGDEEYNFFLTVIFPDDQLQILPYNRVVKNLNGMSGESFLAEVGKVFAVTEDGNPEPAQPGAGACISTGVGTSCG